MAKAKVGDRIRILYDGTCSTDFKAGEIVYCVRVYGESEHGGRYYNLKGERFGEAPLHEHYIATIRADRRADARHGTWELPEEAYELESAPVSADADTWVSHIRRR